MQAVYDIELLPALLDDEEHPAWAALDIVLRALAQHSDGHSAGRPPNSATAARSLPQKSQARSVHCRQPPPTKVLNRATILNIR